MSGKAVALAIDVAMDAADAAAGFDDIGAAARSMGDDVENAARSADTAVSKMDSIADSADNVDSKAAAATGSLGAMSSGLELVGATGAAETLQQAAMATDFLSGAGQGLNLVLQLQVVQQARAKAAQIASAVATKAIAAATKAYSVAQWAMNAALAANPIGLVIIAVVALVAAIVLAYNKSETFRTIVHAALTAVETYFWPVITVIKKIPDGIEAAGDVIDALPGVVSSAKDKVVGFFDDMAAPIVDIWDLIQKIIDKIENVDFPDIPHIPFTRTAGRSGDIRDDVLGRGGAGAGGTAIYLPTVDDQAAVRAIVQLLRRNGVTIGGVVG